MKNFMKNSAEFLQAENFRFLAVVVFMTTIVFSAAAGGVGDTRSSDSDGGRQTTTPVSSGGGGERSAAFFRIFESGTYHMKAKVLVGGIEASSDIYARGGMFASTTSTLGMTTRMIQRDNRTYTIVDAIRTVMVMQNTDTVQAGGVVTDQMRFANSGTARFDGRNLQYDEYSDPDGVRVQYFIDGNSLAGIRTIVAELTVDIIITELNQNVPNNVFDLPTGYRMQEM